MVTVQQLKYFVALNESGAFSEAARSLYISQQGLSMSIAKLETELACRLCERTAKGVVLTEDGEFFLSRAKRILDIMDECYDHFGERDKLPVIQVASCAGILSEFAAREILNFEHEHSDVSVIIREKRIRQLTKKWPMETLKLALV